MSSGKRENKRSGARMHKRSRVLAVTALLALVSTGATVDGGEDSVRYSQTVASSMGYDVEQVRQGLRHQEEVESLVAIAATEYSTIYAGTETIGFPDSSTTIRVTGSAPQALREEVASSWADVTLVDQASHSLEELESFGDFVRTAVAELDVGGHVVGLVPSEAEIHVTVSHRNARGGAVQAADVEHGILSQAENRNPSAARFLKNGGLQLRVAGPGQEVSRSDHTYGAGIVYGDGAGMTAFTVNLDGGGTGVVTAAHLQNVDQYEDPADGPYPLYHQDEHVGGYGETELHTSGHVEPAAFWVSDNSLQDVTSVAATWEYYEGNVISRVD